MSDCSWVTHIPLAITRLSNLLPLDSPEPINPRLAPTAIHSAVSLRRVCWFASLLLLPVFNTP